MVIFLGIVLCVAAGNAYVKNKFTEKGRKIKYWCNTNFERNYRHR